MIVVFQGLPGAGKSMMMARSLVEVLYRNKKWYETQMKQYARLCLADLENAYAVALPKRRLVYHNLLLSAAIREEFADYLRPWDSPDQLSVLRDVDVFWDEIATHIDATQWANMSLELKRWLQQHRKFGIEIYGTCQDFAQVDVSFRRLTQYLLELKKLTGSRDISPTRPNPKFIWGIILSWTLDPKTFNSEKEKFQSAGFPAVKFLTKEDVAIYDTQAEVPVGKMPPLRHIERRCSNPSCDHVKVQHV